MMKIELRKLSDIQPYASNPRRNDRAVEAVVTSDSVPRCSELHRPEQG